MRTKSVIGRMKCIRNTGHVEERGKGGGASSLELWRWPPLKFREGRGGEGGRDGDDGVSSSFLFAFAIVAWLVVAV
jgi:hypothetical protein